jgi:hypothetical protein
MELLNVGCGTKVFEYAINIDVDQNISQNIMAGDAYALDEDYEPNSIDVIYMLCPYEYYPLQSKAYTILKDKGLLVVTGNYSNPYFKELWVSSEGFLNMLGFETVSKKEHCHPEFFHSYTSNGNSIELTTLKQVTLRKR